MRISSLHSGGSRNPGISIPSLGLNSWTPAFAGVTITPVV